MVALSPPGPGGRSVLGCLLCTAACSAAYTGNWCFARPRPGMTLHSLPRQACNRSPKDSPDMNLDTPQSSSSPWLSPASSREPPPSPSWVMAPLLPLPSLPTVQQPEECENLQQTLCLLCSEPCNGSHPKHSKTRSPSPCVLPLFPLLPASQPTGFLSIPQTCKPVKWQLCSHPRAFALTVTLSACLCPFSPLDFRSDSPAQ